MSVLKTRPNPSGSCLLHYVQQKAIRTRSAGSISWDGEILSLCGCCCHQRVKRVRKRERERRGFRLRSSPRRVAGIQQSASIYRNNTPSSKGAQQTYTMTDGREKERERERERVGTGRDKVKNSS